MRARELRVREVMKPAVKTIAKEATIEAAARMMEELGVSSLVIEPDDDKDAFGIVTRKDVIEALLLHEDEDLSYLVEDVMSKPAITIAGHLSIENCLRMMRVAGTRRLPVVEGTQLIGIISNTDIFTKIIAQIS